MSRFFSSVQQTHTVPSFRSDAPPPCPVPHFAPVQVRGGWQQVRRVLRCRRRAVAAGLAVTAASLVAAGPGGPEDARGHPGADAHPTAAAGQVQKQHPVAMVTVPVRIADAATVRLLRPGDRVDVIAADGGGEARVVAAGAQVVGVPPLTGVPPLERSRGGHRSREWGRAPDADPTESGALVVFSVPRPTAARLAGAGASSRLAVTLC